MRRPRKRGASPVMVALIVIVTLAIGLGVGFVLFGPSGILNEPHVVGLKGGAGFGMKQFSEERSGGGTMNRSRSWLWLCAPTNEACSVVVFEGLGV